MSDLKRVRVTRVLTYQGPTAWVDGCLSRMLEGVVQIGTDQFVIASNGQPEEEPVHTDLEPDAPVTKFWARPPGDVDLAIHQSIEDGIASGTLLRGGQ